MPYSPAHALSGRRRAARQRYGLLEKKKDYQQRAQDYHRKEKALQVLPASAVMIGLASALVFAAPNESNRAVQDLRRKADDRNADEFYFAMEHRRTKAGVDIGRCAGSGACSHHLTARVGLPVTSSTPHAGTR